MSQRHANQEQHSYGTRLEPNVAMPTVSAAISLKRIADSLEKLVRKALEDEINRG